MRRNLTKWTHGRAGTYVAGCRCAPCRNAHAVARRTAERARSRALQRLRKKHEAEFEEYYRDEALALGVRVGQPGRPSAKAV
jgi:hypothetical protein